MKRLTARLLLFLLTTLFALHAYAVAQPRIVTMQPLPERPPVPEGAVCRGHGIGKRG